jgi:hypothetical protein
MLFIFNFINKRLFFYKLTRKKVNIKIMNKRVLTILRCLEMDDPFL